jgi:uncharacterized protein YjbJ (UPF0337 family)
MRAPGRTIEEIIETLDSAFKPPLCEVERRNYGLLFQFRVLWPDGSVIIELKKWGQFTDNDLLEAEGDYDKFLGIVQKRYGDKKEDVEQWTTDWYSKREREEVAAKKATESRNQR